MRMRWLATGLVAGLLFSTSPVEAQDQVTRRLNSLRRQMQTLRGTVNTLRGQVAGLEQKAFLLTASGEYTGFVSGGQVRTPVGCDSTDALWAGSPAQGLTC